MMNTPAYSDADPAAQYGGPMGPPAYALPLGQGGSQRCWSRGWGPGEGVGNGCPRRHSTPESSHVNEEPAIDEFLQFFCLG